MRHDSFICVTWLIHTCDMTHSYMYTRHNGWDSRQYVTPNTSKETYLNQIRPGNETSWLSRQISWFPRHISWRSRQTSWFPKDILWPPRHISWFWRLISWFLRYISFSLHMCARRRVPLFLTTRLKAHINTAHFENPYPKCILKMRSHNEEISCVCHIKSSEIPYVLHRLHTAQILKIYIEQGAPLLNSFHTGQIWYMIIFRGCVAHVLYIEQGMHFTFWKRCVLGDFGKNVVCADLFFWDSCHTRGISKNVTWHTHRCSFSRSLFRLTNYVTWLLHIWGVSHSYLRRVHSYLKCDSFMSEVCLIDIWDVTDSYLRRDSLMSREWLILSSSLPTGTRQYGWDSDSFMYVAWLIHICGMIHSLLLSLPFCRQAQGNIAEILTHSYVWHDSFICVAWLIHMCGMTHSYVWHDSFICVTWLIHMRGMTHTYMWHDSIMHVTWLIHSLFLLTDCPHAGPPLLGVRLEREKERERARAWAREREDWGEGVGERGRERVRERERERRGERAKQKEGETESNFQRFTQSLKRVVTKSPTHVWKQKRKAWTH